ncbi:hypothetical protein EDB85DRAFT_1013242 [Lactarius pseudohatsudake]|nr:hypothetical protein EDB85DRAFT_1013242 [Lactarius pseudohatsudake]
MFDSFEDIDSYFYSTIVSFVFPGPHQHRCRLSMRCVTSRAYQRAAFFFTEVSRMGELNLDELERLVTVIQNPTQFKSPLWLLTVGVSKKRGKATVCAGSTHARSPSSMLLCHVFFSTYARTIECHGAICSSTHLSGIVATRQQNRSVIL